MKFSTLALLLTALCIVSAGPAQASPMGLGAGDGSSGGDGIPTWVEYAKQVKATQNISALENGFSGEHVSLYNGATSFSVTDIDVPGNFQLPVQLARTLSVELQPQDGIQPYDSLLHGAGNWDVDVPFMAATYPTSTGWNAQRCSMGSVPEIAGLFFRNEVWQGIAIHVPGRGDATALGLDSQVPIPSSGGPYRLTTSERDAIACIPMQSGLSGEGFRMTTATGVRYYFDVGTTRTAAKLAKSYLPSTESGQMPVMVYLERNRYYLLASKIEDRFGNTVQFQYDASGHPTRIWASDGREITLAYTSGRLSAATSQGRTWQYLYDASGNLTDVIQPDAGRWQYAYSGSLTPPTPPAIENLVLPWCQGTPSIIGEVFTLTATHPGGATASYRFENDRHYRSGVHASECVQLTMPTGTTAQPEYSLLVPYYFDVMSLAQKTLSGPGMSTATWNYAYDYGASLQHLWGTHTEPANYPCMTCKQYKTTTVTNPDGTQQRYQFGMVYSLNDGRLLQQDTLRADGSVIRSQVSTYLSEAETAGQPFYAQYGHVLGAVADPVTARIRPTTSTAISQDGATFTTTVNSFDVYARPITQTASSSLGYSRTEQTAYYDNTSSWVLGQIAERKVNGTSASLTTFDATTALPLTYSSFGNLKQTVTWNADGTLATVKDGDNNITTASNWKRGIPQVIGHADGTTESAEVNDSGWITSVKDENGATTSYGHDAMGRLASITYPTGDGVTWNQTLLSFAPVAASEYGISGGHWKQTVHTGNGYTVTYFDGMWRPLVAERYDSTDKAATLSQTVQRYDANGRKIFASYPSNVVTSYSAASIPGALTSYDALDRATSVQQESELGPLTTTTAYLPGFKTQATDSKGNATTTSYMAFGQPSTDWPVSIAAPENVTQTIGRDVFGSPTSITQAGLYGTESDSISKTLTYDSHHHVCRTTEPESGSTVLAYDGADNISWHAGGLAITGTGCGQEQVAAAAKTTYTYDAMNRVLTILPPAGTQSTTYTYDTRGNLASASSGISYWWANYNSRGGITGEALWLSGQSAWGVGYSYDANNHLAAIGYPGSPSESVVYAPNALGLPTKAGSYASNVTYFPDGKEKSYALGNGITAVLDENTRELPSNLSYGLGASPRFSEDYSYDANGNLTTVADLYNDQNDQTLGYDGLNRLTAASAPHAWGTEAYTYDALNNLRSKLAAGLAFTFNYDPANRLTSLTVGTGGFSNYQYDAHGNRTHQNVVFSSQSMTYDDKNQLLQVVGVASYAYDAAGRRVMKTPAAGGAAAASYSFYNQAGQLLYGYDAASALGTNYIYLNGKLIARHRGTNTTYLLTDRLGSPVRETNTAGTVTASFSYRPYGDLYSGPSQSEPGFTGHVNDPESGFTYMQARYYDAGTGRFLSVDPVGPSPGDGFNFNRYAYADNNPIVNIDPEGRQIWRAFGGEPCRFCFAAASNTAKSANNSKAPPPTKATTLETVTVTATAAATTTSQVAEPIAWRLIAERLFVGLRAVSVPTIVIGGLWPKTMDAPACEMPGNSPCGLLSKTPDVPTRGPPGEWVDGRRRSRLYRPDGRPKVDIDNPHQGADYPHVHEWDEDGNREHPGREVPDLPSQEPYSGP